MQFRLRTLLILLAVGPPVVFAIALVSGSSSGRGEFSPDTLVYRGRSEVLLCGTHVPVFRSQWRGYDHELVEFLIEKGYWDRSSTTAPRWIFLFHSSSQWRDGESAFHRSFFWKRKFWIDWTNKHPGQAAAFWPHILELLRSGDERQAVELLHEVLHSP
jgi:hypothetical protein